MDATRNNEEEKRESLYQCAEREIRSWIEVYLRFAQDSRGFAEVDEASLADPSRRVLLLAGLGMGHLRQSTPAGALEEWRRRQAVPFDVEAAITAGVYSRIRSLGEAFLDSVESSTNGFREFRPEFIAANPQLLPLLQHLAGVFSKAALKKLVGSVSDNRISKPAAERIAKLLASQVDPSSVNKGEVLQRLESTLEGIVRDLVGRVLLESIVAAALESGGVEFKRESEYASLAGVVYDCRADFLVPDEVSPIAFIEVRKSSSRHASLYAKDKMFSAINWKGRKPDMLAILVVDGEWTGETLRVMANVFDYVVPVSRANDVADVLRAYSSGDRSKLKWLVKLEIEANPG